MPSSMICLSKTHAIIGDAVDFTGLAVESEDMTEVLDGLAGRQRALKRHLAEKAKSFRELEALIQALDLLETARSLQTILLEQR
jgi:nuclear pore complex protein Nup107